MKSDCLISNLIKNIQKQIFIYKMHISGLACSFFSKKTQLLLISADNKYGVVFFKNITRKNNMTISTNDYSGIMESIQKSNDLLRMMAAAKLSIDEKEMRMNIIAKVSGMGEHVDEFV